LRKPKKPTWSARAPVTTPTAIPAPSPPLKGRANELEHPLSDNGHEPTTATWSGTASIRRMPYTIASHATT
jgi:hypothetical protein